MVSVGNDNGFGAGNREQGSGGQSIGSRTICSTGELCALVKHLLLYVFENGEKVRVEGCGWRRRLSECWKVLLQACQKKLELPIEVVQESGIRPS